MNLCKIHSGLIHNFIEILRTILKNFLKKRLNFSLFRIQI